MFLEETAELMMSADYKDRFKAEYYQLLIRYEKLKIMLEKWDEDELTFPPTCERSIYDDQIKFMQGYLEVLEKRAEIEEVAL